MIAKKITLFITITSLSILSIKGQTTFKKELSIGASFGMGLSSVSFYPKIQVNQLLGTNIGISGRWITENHLGLIAEINYAQQGWDEKFDDPQYKYKRVINTIELPIFTHIYFGGEKVRYYINLGPKVGYIIGDKATSNFDLNNEIGTNDDIKLRTKAIQNKFTWGLCGGPGIEFRTGIGCFLLEGRYYYALGDLFESRKSDTFKKSSSQVLSAKLTYFLPLNKK